MRHGRLWLAPSLVILSGWTVWSLAQPPNRPAAAERPADEVSAEEAREKAIAERFQKVLDTNPRRGTALDRLYGYHVERGTLDKLVADYAGRAKTNRKDGAAWMIVGLLESQRGKDAAAVAAFKQAEENLPDNALPSYYLGQSLVLVGQPDAAAEAFERAIKRQPTRADLLDVYQALGRVYQRAQKTEQALAVWARLEKQFPDDMRVQEQIATTLAEEGQFEQALPRYEKLAKAVKDAYRQSTFRMEAAELKVRLKRGPQALTDLETLLGELNPESWLYRDVRRKIDEVFLRNDDLAGLSKYYEGYVAKHPDDVEAMARLARALASQGRAADSRDWLKKALDKAPTRRELRQAMIEQFVAEQKYVDAIAQYEAMDKHDPNNPDTLRDWGKLILRDQSRPEPERKAAAVAVWKRLLDRRKDDPVATAQVADLVRVAGLTDEAITLYKKAIDLAPGAAQYREYLGEYLHSQKRKDEALAAWRPIAEGANRNAKNLARLGEVLAGFGYRTEAIAVVADALTLDKDDFNLIIRHADLLHQDQQNDAALKQLDAAGKLTTNAEEVEKVLVAQIKCYQGMDKLGERIDELQKDLDAGKDATADRWLRLARYFEANRQAEKATEAIARAGEKDPKSIPVLTAGARIYESAGDFLAAAEANRKLAGLDRRFRTEYLTAVAKLEQRLGRREQALQAGRDLLASAPGNPDVYKFFADLCFQVGDPEEGLEALRKSVRANPSDPQGLITLAAALSERVRQGEAIELLWRAFEKTNELEAKLGVIGQLTALYLENNQFDRLMERLERERREADKQREMTLCIAQAYTSAGDLGTARQQLERLLTENNKDTHLLGQLVSLCEQEGDVTSAVKYQRQLNAAAPDKYEQQLKLAQLLTRVGEPEEAAEIWVKLVAGETEPHKNLTAIDQLFTAGKHESALAILSRFLARNPGNWELLYREGAALAARGRGDEAAARFTALLAAKAADDDLGEIAKHRIKQAKKTAQSIRGTGSMSSAAIYNPYGGMGATPFDESRYPPLSRRTQNVYQVRAAVGMDSQERYYGSGSQPPFYVPSDYGEARMAALGWLFELARPKDGSDAFAKKLKESKDKSGADQRALWDWYYFQTLRGYGQPATNKDLLPTALALSKGPDPSGLLAYLNAVTSRPGQTNPRISRGGVVGEIKDNTPPLPPEQLTHLVACYKKLQQVKPEWITSAYVTPVVMTELKRAKREDDEKALYQEMLASATTVDKIPQLVSFAANRDDMDAVVDLFHKLARLQGPAKNAAQLSQLPTRQLIYAIEQVMGKRAEAKKFDDVLKLADLYLTTARRQNIAAPPTGSASRRRPGGQINLYFGQVKGLPQNAALSYPTANDYYDDHCVSALYATFLLYKNADLTSDLFAHFRKQLDAAQGTERTYLLLALGYLHWWAEEKDEALGQLAAAVQNAPTDHSLLMEVASLREQNGEHDAALTLLDSVTPLDTQMMQRREEAALRLAERTGNIDRARKAADRMFGLRLDADKQLELAGKMHRLGMHEAAETVLGRAQRQAGNKTATLVRLMMQYQSQNQSDLAVQIARQILRRGPSVNTSGPSRGGGDENSGARNQAIGVLARSGQLKEMIERAEAQLKTSPKSVQIHQSLIDYYRAAGDKDKVKEAVLKMADLKPEDGKLRFQAAQQLQQMGERDAALVAYKTAIKLDPTVFANSYYEIQNLFAQANKFEELAQVLDEIDLKKLGSYWTVTEPIVSLLQNDKGKELGLRLFKKAWEAYPQYRSYLLSRLYREEIWRMPEIYVYARQAVVPREDSEMDPWQSAAHVMSYGQEGRLDGVITRLLSITRKQQRLPELRAEVQDAMAKRPDWTGGKALLAVIDIQSGNKEAGMKAWREVFADPKADIPPLARFILTQELEFYAGVEEMAVQTLEAGIEDMLKDTNTTYQYSYHPARRLAWWYTLLGRKDDARKLTLRFSKMEQVNPGYSGGYWQYQIVQNGLMVAQEMVAAGDPVEAVRIYNQLLSDKETLDQANQYYGGGDRFDQQVAQGLKNALKAIKPATLPSAVTTLLTPRESSGKGPVIDMVLIVESRETAKATLNSVLATTILATDKAPEVRKAALARLTELVEKHPTDFSVQTTAALAAFASGETDAARAAVDRLVKLTESTPLEPVPAGKKPNSRQRDEAKQQLPLWLVARECLRKDRSPFWPAGEKLSERAAAAARRQQNTLMLTAVLREWGQLELDRGDAAKAEARWSEILDGALPKPNPAKAVTAAPAPPLAPTPTRVVPAAPIAPPPAKGPSPQSRRHTSGPVAPGVFAMPQDAAKIAAERAAMVQAIAAQKGAKAAPPAAAGAPGLTPVPRGNIPVLTAEQFQQAYEVAMMAADKNLPGLSLRAMREAVRGGPPIVPTNRRSGGGRLTSRMIGGVQYYTEDSGDVGMTVDRALVTLVPKWRTIRVSAADIYDVLVAAVMPDARPAEVLLHTEGRPTGTVYAVSGAGYLTPTSDVLDEIVEDRGLGRLLAEVAVEAGKVDDLRAKAEARSNQPLGELPARILLTMLALKAKDDARATEMLKALGERIRKDSSQGTNDRVTTVLQPAFAEPKFAAMLLPYVEKAAENYAAGNNIARASELRFKLAEYQLAHKDEAAARTQFKAVEALAAKTGTGAVDVRQPLARQYLKAGWVEDALRELGLHADSITAASADPRVRGRRAEPTLAEFPRLVWLLLAMPADKRYEALKTWSLPTAGRKSVRYYVGLTPKHVPPSQFVKLPPMPANEIVSTMTLLADAAKAVGKLDELTAETDKLVTDKIENAEMLSALVHLARGDAKKADPSAKAFSKAARSRLTAKAPEQPLGSRSYDYEGRQPVPIYPSELAFASRCLTDPSLVAHGEALLGPMLTAAQNTRNTEFLIRVRAAWDRLGASRAGSVDALTNGVPSHWYNASARSVWFAQDGYLCQAWNDQPSYLLLDTPLTGTFEFSVDAYQGAFAEGHVGYAGVVYEPNRTGTQSIVWPVGKYETIARKADGIRTADFNRLTVQVSPGKVRCLVNGQLFYEDTDPPTTSPWVMLMADSGRRPVFRNFTLTGKPEVLSEVKLIDGDMLGGWLTHLYGGALPQRLMSKEQTQTADRSGTTAVPGAPVMMGVAPGAGGSTEARPERVYDWQAKNGEILGRKLTQPPDRPVPSKLAYNRPLRPGETLRYEFFYEPGKTHVHPSLGRLAFLLEPDGVKLHWLTDRAAEDWTGLAADNVADDPAGRRADKLPLKADDWNTLTLINSADSVKLELNGTAIYETMLGADAERFFGLFHYRDRTAVRVRNVVLTGNWPKTLPPADEIALTAKPANAAEARARRWQLGERYYFTEAGEVVARSKQLSPAERYKALADWVLPTESRPAFQLAGVIKPLDVLGVVDQATPDEPGVTRGRREMLGNRFEAPALEMVAAAKQAGSLDELADRLIKADVPGADDLYRRSRLAMLAVVRAAQGQDAEAAGALKQLVTFILKMKVDAHGPERWPDLIAVLGTLDRPALHKPATDLATAINKNIEQSTIQDRPFDERDWWIRAYRMARGRAIVAQQPEGIRRPYGSDANFAHWAAVSGVDAAGRTQGHGVPHWTYRDGTLSHFPGHADDYLLLRTPLRGDFEVSCEMRLQGWQELHLRYGPIQFDLMADRKKYRLHTAIRFSSRELTINPPLPAAAKASVYQLKATVKDGWFRAFVDGQEVVAERIGPTPDPWLMLHAPYQNTAELRDLKITGSPTLPDSVDLLAGDDLALWRPYLGSLWTKRGEEIHHSGRKPEPPEEGKPVPPRGFPEAAMYYQRPLVEDGAVEYEFFHDPDKVHAHPMLDRLVFLLEPEGVKLHWLTDGVGDKSGVAVDNATDEPSCRRGPTALPLKPQAWNKVRLAVVGDTVKLAINGTEVYERPIEPTNQRLFGVFHYTDRTEARVRSMTYSGDWPKQLPAGEKLFEVKK